MESNLFNLLFVLSLLFAGCLCAGTENPRENSKLYTKIRSCEITKPQLINNADLTEICRWNEFKNVYQKLVVKTTSLKYALKEKDSFPGYASKENKISCDCECYCETTKDLFEIDGESEAKDRYKSEIKPGLPNLSDEAKGEKNRDSDKGKDERSDKSINANDVSKNTRPNEEGGEEKCLQCETENQVLICYKRINWNGKGPKYVPRCVDASATKDHFNKGSVLPDKKYHGKSYDCNCEEKEVRNPDDREGDDGRDDPPRPGDPECTDYGCADDDENADGRCFSCGLRNYTVLCSEHVSYGEHENGRKKNNYVSPKCVINDKIASYLDNNAFYPNSTNRGRKYDCNCKVVDPVPPPSVTNPSKPSPKPSTKPGRRPPRPPHGNCDDHPNDDCSKESGELTLKRNTTCNIRKLDTNLYRLTVVATVENDEPTALVVGLNAYNEELRTRGTCDNRGSNAILPWNGGLWNAVSAPPNAPLWRVKNVLPQTDTSLITYEADFTLNDLLNCEGPAGETGLVVVSEKNTLYEGTWYISKNIPVDIDDESEGELIQFEKQCSFQIHQSGSGVDSICYVTDRLKLFVRWLKSLCTPEGRLGFLLETCVISASADSEDKTVLYSPRVKGSPSVPNGTFSVTSVGAEGECYYVNEDDGACCQRWIVEGLTDDALPPFVESIVIKWKKGKRGDDLNDPEYVAASGETDVIINACVLDSCDDFNLVKINDTITGKVRLYTDPRYLYPYTYQRSNPFSDCANVFAQLHLNVPKTQCMEFSGLFRRLVLKYIGKDGEILEEITVYEADDPSLPNDYNVTILTDPSKPCYPRITWSLKTAHYSKVKVIAVFTWNVTHVPVGTVPLHPSLIEDYVLNRLKGYDISDDSEDGFSRNAAGAGNAFPVRSGRLDKLATNHHFLNDDSEGLKETARTKKMLADNVDRIKYSKYAFAEQRNEQWMEVQCGSKQDWDGSKCNGDYDDIYYWFPGARHGDHAVYWSFSFVVLLAIVIAIPLVWCGCGHVKHYYHRREDVYCRAHRMHNCDIPMCSSGSARTHAMRNHNHGHQHSNKRGWNLWK